MDYAVYEEASFAVERCRNIATVEEMTLMQSPRVGKYTPEELEGVKSEMSVVQLVQFELFITAEEVLQEEE